MLAFTLIAIGVAFVLIALLARAENAEIEQATQEDFLGHTRVGIDRREP